MSVFSNSLCPIFKKNYGILWERASDDVTPSQSVSIDILWLEIYKHYNTTYKYQYLIQFKLVEVKGVIIWNYISICFTMNEEMYFGVFFLFFFYYYFFYVEYSYIIPREFYLKSKYFSERRALKMKYHNRFIPPKTRDVTTYGLIQNFKKTVKVIGITVGKNTSTL